MQGAGAGEVGARHDLHLNINRMVLRGGRVQLVRWGGRPGRFAAGRLITVGAKKGQKGAKGAKNGSKVI